MIEKDLISVIVPVYNVEKYLTECITSIISQTYKNLEILLIDDGSTDLSGKICDEYVQKDSRVKVIHKANEGVSSARNLGVDIATGEYVTFVDGDDFVDKDYVFKLYEALSKNDSDMAFCGFSYYSKKKIEHVQEELPSNVSVSVKNKDFLKIVHGYFNWKMYGVCWRTLYKKKLVKKNRFKSDLKVGEDSLFCMQNILAAERLNSVAEGLYFYRINIKSVIRSYKKNFLQNELNLYREIKDVFSLFDDKKSRKVFQIYCAGLCYGVFSNEIKYKVFDKDVIKKTRERELYPYFKLKNVLRIYGIKRKVKFLIVWFLVKTRLIDFMKAKKDL